MKSFLVDQDGYYGEFGGAYVPEILHKCVEELKNTYLGVLESEDFKKEFDQLLRDYVVLILLLPIHQCIQQGQRLLILCRRVHQLLPAAQRAGHVLKLAPAHLFFLQVDHLEPDAPLLEIALGLFGIKALAGAKDLNVHRFSSWILCALLYHICRKKPRDNSSSFRPYLLYHKPPLRLNEGWAISEREELSMKAFVDPDLCIGCTQCTGIHFIY